VVRAVDFAQRNGDVSGWTVGGSEGIVGLFSGYCSLGSDTKAQRGGDRRGGLLRIGS